VSEMMGNPVQDIFRDEGIVAQKKEDRKNRSV
jgi:hypothetical protein